MGDGGAAAGVGIGLGAGPAVVVGDAAAGARCGVAPQGAVADVAGGGKDAATHLGTEVELVADEALGEGTAAVRVGGGGDPAERNPTGRGMEEEGGSDEEKGEGGRP